MNICCIDFPILRRENLFRVPFFVFFGMIPGVLFFCTAHVQAAEIRSANILTQWQFDDSTNLGKDSGLNGWDMDFVGTGVNRMAYSTQSPSGTGGSLHGWTNDGDDSNGFVADFAKI